jgi:NDP-sugar pyrophosphorylase family protein
MIVLAPIAGRSPHFSPEEFAYPKPLIEIGGRPMIAWAIDNLATAAPEARFVFVAGEAEARRYSYESIFDLATGGRAKTLTLKAPTGGALCTCLMAIDAIDADEPLIIANTDQIIDTDLSEAVARFQAADADAGVLIFDSLHPRWSYVALADDGFVQRASEKEVISRHAIAGFYYYRRAGLFFAAAAQALRHGATLEGQHYISASLNEVILLNGKVMAVEIDARQYHSFYDPRNIESFELSRAARQKQARDLKLNVLIPAAGQGSRFAVAGYAKPKPFIDVDGEPMIRRVLDNMPSGPSQPTVILRKDHVDVAGAEIEELARRGVRVVAIDKLTEGTACTILLAREHLDNDQPLLIANSDQLVDVSLQAFVDDCFARDLDGSILVFRDPSLNPKWSFARTDAAGLVQQVAEKVAISDLATVGIYLFRKGSHFVDAAIDMIANNDRVNNEFYTCPVYNYMIRAGLRIGVYEIESSAMHGLGTPEDLSAYLAAAKAAR